MLSPLSAPVAVTLLAQSSAPPNFFTPVVLILFIAGAVAALVAAILGFRRAAAFGTSARWFALSTLCLFLYHVQFLAFVVFAFIAVSQNNFTSALGFGAFFNLFIVLAAICAVMGFVRLTDSR
jgi:hypothetical protein